MRGVILNYKDYCLFGEGIQSTMYNFFCTNKPTFRHMMEDQGHLFWRRYLVTFKAHCMDGNLLDNPYDMGTPYRHMILEGFGYIDLQLLHCDRAPELTQAFIEDMALVNTHRRLLVNIDPKRNTKDPFRKRETREVFRKLFGDPSEGNFVKVKAWMFTTIFLRFAGGLIMTLRRWMDSSDVDEKEFSYWLAPPCDIFMFYSFSDEVFKLLPSEIDRSLPKVDRREISRIDREKYGDEEIDKYKPRNKEPVFCKDSREDKTIFRVTKPVSSMILEVNTSIPNRFFPRQNSKFCIESFRLVHHHHNASCSHRKLLAVNNDDRLKQDNQNVEETIYSIMQLMTSEERKRYLHGLMGVKTRRKKAEDPHRVTYEVLHYGNRPDMPTLHDLCQKPKSMKNPYVYKICSKCSEMEKEKKKFKICKICHDRISERFRSYCSRDCQVSDWHRHSQEHRAIEKIKRVMEDENDQDWEVEYTRYTTGFYKARDPFPELPKKEQESSTSTQDGDGENS